MNVAFGNKRPIHRLTPPKNKDFIFGFHPVLEAINNGREIEKVFIKKGLQGELYPKLFSRIQSLKIPFQFVPVEKLNRITTHNHQGVVAYISPIIYEDIERIIPFLYEEGRNPAIVILDEITDVRNFGSIARSAECAGIDAIIIPVKHSVQINAEAIKTSAGALNYTRICRVNSLSATIHFLKDSGIKIIAATEKGEKIYHKTDMSIPLALIMGSEDKGIRDHLLALCDEKISIPVLGKIQSLNVSNASAVLFYEIVRQRIGTL